jgi:protein-S-isoprenylcysteine O-methyltransferase Ste14
MQRLGYLVITTSAIVVASIVSIRIRRLNRQKVPPGTICIDIPSPANTIAPGSILSRATIMISFGTGMILLFATLLFSLIGIWDLLPSWSIVTMPRLLVYISYGLLWLYYCWGVLVIRYNVNYTPCYRSIAGRYYIATAGPYSIIKHPMYAAKAAFPVIMFCATGFLPFLIGLLSWTVLRYQAKMEEDQLAELGGNLYNNYCAKTGRFIPRIIKRNE